MKKVELFLPSMSREGGGVGGLERKGVRVRVILKRSLLLTKF